MTFSVCSGSNAEACSADSDLASLSSMGRRPLLFTSLRVMLCEWAQSTALLPTHALDQSGAYWLIICSTMDTECKITSELADCVQTIAGPEANDPGVMSAVVSDLTNSLLPVTITAGLEKIQAGGSATATGSSGTAEPTGSAASGPSETGSSASRTGEATSATGTSTSASSTSASSSTAANGAVAGAGQNLVLAGLSGVLGLVMAL